MEIDNAGPGIRAEVQALITRLTSGGVGVKTDDPRLVQAKRLWDKGFFLALNLPRAEMSTFEQYLATIPDVPEELKAPDERFPLLALVDARLRIVKACEFLGVDYSGNDQTFEDFDPEKAKTDKVYWIRAQDGRKNKGKSVQTCRKQFADDEVGLTVHEGLALFAQNPEGHRGWAMDLCGSVFRENRDDAAYLYWFLERPKLYWRWYGHGDPYYGSASRAE